jgi:hypothetical protein
MRRACLHFSGIVTVVVLISGCGGPTSPSKTSATPGPSGAQGTIALVSSTPAPGGDLVVDPAPSGKTPSLSAIFSVTIDRAVKDVSLEVRLLDGSDQSCGSATSDAQSLTAGQAASFTLAAIAISCAPPASIEKLSATLVGTVSSQRTEFLGATIPAHYALRVRDTTVTLSGTVTEAGVGALAGATVDVTDGPDLGKSTTTDTAGRYVLSGLKPGSITVRAGKAGYENSSMKVTLGSTTATQDFTIARSVQPRPPGPGTAGIVFLGSDPAPGSEVVMTENPCCGLYLRDLQLQFAVQVDQSLPDAKLEVELFGDGGQQCAYMFVDQAIPANQSVPVVVNGITSWQLQTCNAFPVAIASVKATLLTLRGPEINGHLTRTDYVSQSFPIRYTIRRYPPPPPGVPASLPVISDLTWKVNVPTVGSDPPLAGDPVSLACTARETDGAPLTLTITLTWDTLAPKAYTLAFPAGASSSPEGARLGVVVGAPNNGQPKPHARLECLVTNDRGQSARKSTDIGTPPL